MHQLPLMPLSRRSVLRACGALGTLLSASLLAACGGSAAATITTTSAGSAISAATSAGPSSSTVSSVAPATRSTGTGTATSASAAAGSVAQGSKAPVTLHMLERQGQEEQALDVRIPQFMQQFPTIKVIRDATPGDIIAKEATLAASDTLPDTVHSYLGDQSYQFFSANGVFISIEDMLARDKLDLTGWFPALIDVMRIDGKLHGLPFKGQVLTAAFFYNSDLFDKAGVTYPTEDWTLDDLSGMAEKLTSRQGTETAVWGFGLQNWGGENWTGIMRQWDAEWLSADGKTAQLGSKPIQTGLQWFSDLIGKTQSQAPMKLDPGGKLFPQSKCAILGRAYFNYKSNNLSPGMVQFKWGVTLPPKGPTGNRGGMFAGDAQAITRDSKAPDAAYELLKWLTDKETGVQLGLQTKGSTTLGGRPDVYADPASSTIPPSRKRSCRRNSRASRC